MKGKVIAVFGISGVGKSSLIKRFISSISGYHHVSAGALLRSALSLPESADLEKLRTAEANTVIYNQIMLARAFTNDRKRNPERHIIFDGHSLIDTDRELIPVPTEAISLIQPSGIIFISGDPGNIYRQRINDGTRFRPERSVHELDQQQAAAFNVCKQFQQTLGVPLVTVESGDDSSFREAALKIIQQTESRNTLTGL